MARKAVAPSRNHRESGRGRGMGERAGDAVQRPGSTPRSSGMSEPIALPLRGRGVTDSFAEDDFGAFVAARGQKLVRMARGLLRDPHTAEDVVQEVLVKAHQHWATICSRESPEAYVRRMLVNASTSFWRRAVRREFSVDSSAWPVVVGADEVAR